MNDVIAGFERRNGIERDACCVPARATDAALATEDLVIGENAKARRISFRRNDEAAAEHADRERGGIRAIAARAEQLVETLSLPRVVAEDERRNRPAHE